MSLRVVVTGGAGFVGSHVVEALLARGHHVAVIDNLISGARDNVDTRAVFYEIDIRDRSRLDRVIKSGFDAVVHLAAQTSVARSWRDPMQDARDNVLGTLSVLECCAAHQVDRLVFSSSAAVYGEPTELPVSEDAPLLPSSPYAVSKHSGEDYTRVFAREYGLRACILRFSNVYGPRQSSSGEAGVVAAFSRAMSAGRVVRVFGDGQQSRDFIFVKDVAAAVALAVESRVEGTMNISTNTSATILELCALVASVMSKNPVIDYGPSRPGDIRHSRLDNALATVSLAWRPSVSLLEGIKKTVSGW